MFTSSEHYAKSYNVFKKKANQQRENVKTLQDYLPSVIQKMMPSLPLGIERRSQFNILSVGGGTGEIDMDIVKIIQRESQREPGCDQVNIFIRAIEPNKCSCKLYKEAIAKFDDPRVMFDVRQQMFQEYQESGNEPMLFDIVHFIHSLYYVDFEQTVLYCFAKELSQKGNFVCLMDDNCLTHWVLEKQQGHLSLCNEDFHQNYTEPKGWEKSRKLVKIADKHGLKHEMYSRQYLMDVTELFDVESVDGNLLLDFMTHTVDFRKTADQKLVQETLALIEELTIVKDGKRFGETTESLVLIYK